MNKYLLPLMIWGCISVQTQTSFAQLKVYTFEQIDSLQKKDKRNVLVFIHADWCKYCQLMKNTTFRNDSIIKLLNNKFYLVTLNAEENKSITFNKYTFKFKPSGTNTGINELAEQLATVANKISYPTICFLNPQNEIIFQYGQYSSAKHLKSLLKQLM